LLSALSALYQMYVLASLLSDRSTHPSAPIQTAGLGNRIRSDNYNLIADLTLMIPTFYRTFAGFFVHLNSIPPVLRWLQWLCPLKFALEALSVNEVGSGLMIKDTLEGVPVNVSASLIMQLVRSFHEIGTFLSLNCFQLFGFGLNNYYR
jgi:hypothetical protein